MSNLYPSLAINRTVAWLKAREQASPLEHKAAWQTRVQRLSPLAQMTPAEQVAAFYCPTAKSATAITNPLLEHLPMVTAGYWASAPQHVARFSFIGEFFFRRSPKELISTHAVEATHIELKINSAGGDLHWVMEFCFAIRSLGRPIVAQICGMAHSAAAVLAQCGDLRQITRSSTMMIHRGAMAVIGHDDDLRAASEDFKAFKEKQIEIFCRTTRRPRAEVAAWVNGETYFSAEQALALGLVDEIVEDDHPPAPVARVVHAPGDAFDFPPTPPTRRQDL